MTRVAVIIPTFNRSTALEVCLRALERERRLGTPFQIVVVDDGCTDDTQRVVSRLQRSDSIDIQYLRQQNAGPATARNRGVAAVDSDIVIFLGDDIVVEHGHIATMIGAYEAHRSDRIGVLGLTHYDPDSIPTPFGRWLALSGGFQFAYRDLEQGQEVPFSATYTSNLLVPRHELLKVGGFDETFRDAAFEDTELGFRLWREGLRFVYCPEARAIHVHPVSVESTARRMRMTARALLQLRSVNPALFAILYPDGERVFGKPGLLRRLVRWIRGPLLLPAIAALDDRIQVPLPATVYEGAMRSTFSREASRRWK